jgi:hypothetical protein
MDIWMSLNGVVRMDVDGMDERVVTLLKMDICMYSSGVVKMDVNGVEILVQMQLNLGIWIS